MPPIVTLTSDLGDSSHYTALLKGMLLSALPEARLVDVSHSIPNFDIMEAAYIVKHCYVSFPPDTIHLISIDPDVQYQAGAVVLYHKQQYFIAPNNGLLSLITDGEAKEAYKIENPKAFNYQQPPSFRAGRIFVPTAMYLANGGKVEEIGDKCSLKELRWGAPSYADGCLRGKIIHIDKFGNAITNITRGDFMSLKESRGFEIFIRNVRLKRIVNTYADVAKADALAIFGESQNLEIAMREASAAELLGLKVHDMITIEFQN